MKELEKLYRRFRALGEPASRAIYAAHTALAWEARVKSGLVKLDIVVDELLYDDSYLDTWGMRPSELERARKELWDRIEHQGVWCIVGYYRPHVGAPWEVSDSICGFVGDDWKNSGYVPDVQHSTLEALDGAFQTEANELASRATYAVVPA
jgi:hypothetical protein